jgi:hypothetical protein
MKYAFVIGTSAFIVPGNTVSFADHESEKDFLKINSIYHDLPHAKDEPSLEINLDIHDTDGTPIFMVDNRAVTTTHHTIKIERDSIQVLKPDGSTIIHVHQLDDDSAMSLEHNLTAEFEVHAPVAVIRITGEFMVGDLHILAENEKLYINKHGYANSAQAGKNKLTFTEKGVVL